MKSTLLVDENEKCSFWLFGLIASATYRMITELYVQLYPAGGGLKLTPVVVANSPDVVIVLVLVR